MNCPYRLLFYVYAFGYVTERTGKSENNEENLSSTVTVGLLCFLSLILPICLPKSSRYTYIL